MLVCIQIGHFERVSFNDKKTKKNKNEENALQLKVSPKELVGSEDMSFMHVLFNDLLSNVDTRRNIRAKQNTEN